MNIKFNLDNLKITQSDINVEIGHVGIEFTDLNLKDYLYYLKEMPSILREFKRALEDDLNLDEDHIIVEDHTTTGTTIIQNPENLTREDMGYNEGLALACCKASTSNEVEDKKIVYVAQRGNAIYEMFEKDAPPHFKHQTFPSLPEAVFFLKGCDKRERFKVQNVILYRADGTSESMDGWEYSPGPEAIKQVEPVNTVFALIANDYITELPANDPAVRRYHNFPTLKETAEYLIQLYPGLDYSSINVKFLNGSARKVLADDLGSPKAEPVKEDELVFIVRGRYAIKEVERSQHYSHYHFHETLLDALTTYVQLYPTADISEVRIEFRKGDDRYVQESDFTPPTAEIIPNSPRTIFIAKTRTAIKEVPYNADKLKSDNAFSDLGKAIDYLTAQFEEQFHLDEVYFYSLDGGRLLLQDVLSNNTGSAPSALDITCAQWKPGF